MFTRISSLPIRHEGIFVASRTTCSEDYVCSSSIKLVRVAEQDSLLCYWLGGILVFLDAMWICEKQLFIE